MTIKLSGSLTISDIIAEFGGASPNSLSNYYAGGLNVPSTTVGFPNGVRTNVPSRGAISFSNFYGASDEYRTSFLLFGIFNPSGGDADNIYFGGDIPRNGGVFINRNSNNFAIFSIPEGYDNATLTASAWQVQLACGYTWEDGGPYSGTDYYYDYQRNFGIMIFDETNGVIAGYIRNTANTNEYTGTFNTYTVPEGTVSLVSGRTYRVYYTCDFRRDSDPGYGDVSFGWYNNSTPFISVLAN